jgi:hypothetical protein
MIYDDHDHGYHTDSTTGICAYCADETAPTADVFDVHGDARTDSDEAAA